ncbi:MAG: hypothetical protein FD126_2727 [Elusimicrobia bacterium]|nr:MAG: hypothetical protein FD126_2727 [Elusimicrobiota bacterium]
MRILLVLTLALLIYAHRHMGLSALEETVWEVRVGVAPFFPFAPKDTLAFDRGRFTSARALAGGTMPAGYQGAGGGGSWEARLRNPDGSTSQWQGSVRGERIKGVVTVTRADGSIKTYKFRGRRRGV